MTLAFFKDGDLYVFDSATGATRLTEDRINDQPLWTADGKGLFFVKRRQGQPDETWHWRAGQTPTRVQNGLWSRDGKAVAFGQAVQGSPPGTEAVTVEQKGKRRQITPTEPAVRWTPLAWSPDSRRLAMARYTATGAMTPKGMQFDSATLWITGQTLSQRSQLPLPPSLGTDMGSWPDLAQWSPNGKFLLAGVGPAQPCISCRVDGLPMYAIPISGGPPMSLEVALPHGAMSWSPIGDWLVISGPIGRDTYNKKHLTRFELLNLSHLDLTSDPAWSDVEPSVSPDASHVAFIRGHSQRQEETTISAIASRRLWVMRADGSNAHQVVESSAWTEEAPTWTPDGKWIVFIRLPAETDAPVAPSLWAAHPDGSSLVQLVPALDTTLQPSERFGYYGQFAWLQLYAVAPH